MRLAEEVDQKEEQHLVGVRKAIEDYFDWLTPIIKSDRFTLVLRHINTSDANGSVLI